MLSSARSIAAAVTLAASAGTTGQPLRPLAAYTLPARPTATYGACSVGANASYAAVGYAWGGRSPISGGFDHFCRGFTLIYLRTGARRTIVRLPAAQQRGLWTVDEPVFVGDWLAYQRYIGATGSNWEINIVNLRTGATRQLDHWHGQGIMDIGPVITRWGHILVWVSGARDTHRRVVYQIHTYDVASRMGRIVATSRPGITFIDAYMSGSIICFLQRTSRGSDVWVEDLRTGRFRQLTHTGRATEAVITGGWVAWHIVGRNALGPVVVDNLRTGRQWTVTKDPSYELTAGNGLLAWDAYWKDQWTILDLSSGRSWMPTRIVPRQTGGTIVHLQGNVAVENAVVPEYGQMGRVEVYLQRSFPAVP